MSDRALDTGIRSRDGVGNPPVRSRHPLGRRSALTLAGLLLAAGAAWYGQYWWTEGRFLESTDDAYVGGDITVLAPRVPGLIATVAVTDNQVVHAGDLLVRIDQRDYRAALDRAEAAVAGQQAALANIEAERQLQLATVDQVRAELAATAAEVARSRFDVERYQELSRSQFASAQRFQQADADSRKAVAADLRARAALVAAERRIDVIDTQHRQAEAALRAAVAERGVAQLNLGYTEIRAPVDGTVGNRSARAGAFAAIGTQLLSIVPAQGLWVDANFKESQLGQMRPGQPVRIEADVLPGEVFHGHVVSLAPATGAQFSVLPAENATGNFTKIVQRVPVRVQLDAGADRLGQLRPGLSVIASVDQGSGRTRDAP